MISALHCALLAGLGSAPQAPPSPSQFLGRPLGGDFTLADWDEVSGYYRALAEASPHLRLERVGETTEGRDFLLATIGSERNLARLPELQARAARLADPRGLSAGEREALLRDPVPFLFVSVAMHSTECAGAQFGMEFAYRLATSDQEPYRSARESLVIFLPPCLNPDGVDHVTHWYRENLGTPFEGTELLELYQRYAGHDNNRDWFGLALEESRIVTGLLYGRLFPQVYWDVHQQGSSRERFFVPPYRDPLNPHLAPEVITAIDALGSRALFDLTRAGFTGISTGVSYDMWWNGGNRNVPVRHNIVGLLTEAASANLASPLWLPRERLSAPRGLGGYWPSNQFPVPWPGGWWRLRDIIDYELAFGESLLGSLVREPRLWLENVLLSAERAVELGAQGTPRAYLIPADEPNRGAVARLVEGLMLGGVEVWRAGGEVAADGRTWPAGSLLIPLDQPYGRHVRDLFERQRYPEGDTPYDVAGWTLPLVFGLEAVEVHGEFGREGLAELTAAESVLGGAEREAGSYELRDRAVWAGEVLPALQRGELRLQLLADGRVRAAAGEADAAESNATEPSSAVPRAEAAARRIGVYAPWSGVMNEGWLRWFLDSFGLEYARVRPELLRAGRLGDHLDVLVLPNLSARELESGRAEGSVEARYTGGLDVEGALAIRSFVRAGGTLVAVDDSAQWAAELFALPLVDTTAGAEGFECPGSVLRTELGPAAAALGLGHAPPVLFADNRAWRVEGEDTERIEVLLEYATDRLLLSGHLRGEQALAGQAAWVRAAEGAGTVHLFAFEPQYRGWTEGAFLLLLRALFFRASAPAAGEAR
jgi:hypothetical protein